MDKLKSIYKRLSGAISRQGHWVALGVSLCLMAGAVVWVAREDNAPPPRPIDYQHDAAAGQRPPFVDSLDDVMPTPALPPATPSPPLPVLAWPARGDILMGYSADKPVYDATLAQWKVHPAVDLKLREGDPVYAAAAGLVTHAGDAGLMGGRVRVEHPDGLATVYESLLLPLAVTAGDRVDAGQPLGGAGAASAERELGAHVHFAAFRDGKPIDPMTLLPKIADK